MDLEETNFTVRLAESKEDLTAAKRLRYMVFVEELGASASDSDHERRLETDRFDEWFDHLILIDNRLDRLDSNYVVGSYRLLRGDVAASECGFYSESEFDLSVIKNLGRPVVELGLPGPTMHKIDERAATADLHRLTAIYHSVLMHYFPP